MPDDNGVSDVSSDCERVGDNRTISVAILEDNSSMRRGLAVELTEAGFEVCAACAEPAEFLILVETCRPSVALIDLRIYESFDAGLEALESVRQLSPSTGCVVYTNYDSVANLDTAMRLGARGFVCKNVEEEKSIPEVVRLVAQGAQYFSTDLLRRFVSAVRRPVGGEGEDLPRDIAPLPLTDRELEVLQLMWEGLANQQMAEKLFVSVNTIKAHKRNIFDKFQVSTSQEAVHYGRTHGVI